MEFLDLDELVHDESYLAKPTDHLMDCQEPVTSLISHSTSAKFDVFSYDDDTLRSCLIDSSSDHLIDDIINNDPLMGCISNSETNKDPSQPETFSFTSSDWISDFSASLTGDLLESSSTSSFISSTDLFKFCFPSELPSASTCESCDQTETTGPSNNCGNHNQQSSSPEINNREFKKILSLNVDNSELKEPWISSVGKKILATYYTPINIKSEFLSNRISLDEFESLALIEAVNAFRFIASRNGPAPRRNLIKQYSCSKSFVRNCEKVRAYRKLHADDKITLLSNVFFDIHAMKSIITFDHRTDSFEYSGKRLDRVKVFHLDPDLHDGLNHVIETFPDRWRNDLKAIAVIYLIVIFNPDLPDLKYADAIRMEQYAYIYLLGRYLESVCESPSDASDNLYRLMVKIEEIQKLRDNMVNIINAFRAGASLDCKNIIITAIQNSITSNNLIH
ncbi:uncharacterized protein LOC107359876 [Tetranychus urticae]|uniref:uncharacterized protein LOC107359876 n=1 Tax=Tetranychus urticae TaxID=32264 RepID=UPI00077C0417|nr:uncharacterized protein LOC107359876 [Tetranychus urticae]